MTNYFYNNVGPIESMWAELRESTKRPVKDYPYPYHNSHLYKLLSGIYSLMSSLSGRENTSNNTFVVLIMTIIFTELQKITVWQKQHGKVLDYSLLTEGERWFFHA